MTIALLFTYKDWYRLAFSIGLKSLKENNGVICLDVKKDIVVFASFNEDVYT